MPITLGAAENAVWTEVAGLFWEDMNDDSTQPLPYSYNVAGMFNFGRIIWRLENYPTLWLHQPGALSGGVVVRPHQYSGR